MSTAKVKHTDGPWRAEYRPDSEDNFCLLAMDADDKPFEYSILEGSLVLGDDKKNEANAHLIAAAPELLEALQAYLAHAGFAITRETQARLSERAIAAIAHAIGETELTVHRMLDARRQMMSDFR